MSFAEVKFDPNKLKHELIKEYEKYPEFISVLDSWILVPDRKNTEKLQLMSKAFNEICPLDKNIDIYRGFDTKNYLQNGGLCRY